MDLEGASIVSELVQALDEQVLVILRDGKKLIGTLKTFDHHGNLVIQDAIERVYLGTEYGEQKAGACIVRGENVLLIGRYTPEFDIKTVKVLTEKPIHEILDRQRAIAEESRNVSLLKKMIKREAGQLELELLSDL